MRMTRILILATFVGLTNLAIGQTVIFVGPIGISKGNSVNLVGVGNSPTFAQNALGQFDQDLKYSQGPGTFNSPSDHLIPDHIRENPMQFSYLCRLEKKIERKLPVGLWLKLENNNFAQSFSPRPGNAYIRMKMLRF